jgi:hypothetical protein
MFETQKGPGHQKFGQILSRTRFVYIAPNVWSKILAVSCKGKKNVKGETRLFLKGPQRRLN